KSFYFVFPAFLFVSGVAQFSDISQPVSFQTAKLGDPVTIECHIKSVIKSRVWYKLTTGRTLQLIATTHGSQNHHYSVKFGGTENHLSISATTWEDTGRYYCGVAYLNFIEFGSGTFLMLKGTKSSSISVVQQPESESVQPGDSVTLSCSVHTGDCGGEHTSVFWLKSSESSGPEMIYFYGNRNDSCERTETGSLETSCVYQLPKQNLSSDDAGTYYCVTFKLKITALSPAVITLVLCNIVLGMATLLLVWVLCKSRSKDPTGITHCASDAVTYAAVSLAARSSYSRAATVKRSRDAVLYSEVRYHQQD
uniref:Ig-like domain-containing protein n=1 Tax=Myripristis murdjan TaxID=586833 RepID=A0A667YYQ8_9TELE